MRHGTEPQELALADRVHGVERSAEFDSGTFENTTPLRPVLTSRQPRAMGKTVLADHRVIELDMGKAAAAGETEEDDYSSQDMKKSSMIGITSSGAMQGTLRDLQKKEKLY